MVARSVERPDVDDPITEARSDGVELLGVEPQVLAGQGQAEGHTLVGQAVEHREQAVRPLLVVPPVVPHDQRRLGDRVTVGRDPVEVHPDGQHLAAVQDPVEPVGMAVIQGPAQQDRQRPPQVGELGLGVHQHPVRDRHRQPVGQGQALVGPVPGPDRMGQLVLVQVQRHRGVAQDPAQEPEQRRQVHHVADQQNLGWPVAGDHRRHVLGQGQRRAPQPPPPVGGVVGDQVDLVPRVGHQPVRPRPVRPPVVRLDEHDPGHPLILPVLEARLCFQEQIRASRTA